MVAAIRWICSPRQLFIGLDFEHAQLSGSRHGLKAERGWASAALDRKPCPVHFGVPLDRSIPDDYNLQGGFGNMPGDPTEELNHVGASGRFAAGPACRFHNGGRARSPLRAGCGSAARRGQRLPADTGFPSFTNGPSLKSLQLDSDFQKFLQEQERDWAKRKKELARFLK
jgi:hypothetical protein